MVAEQLRALQIDACGIQESRITGPDLLFTGGYIRVVGGPSGGSLECEVWLARKVQDINGGVEHIG
eukprot:15352357-Alexandrium_andersonii.AAC.1